MKLRYINEPSLQFGTGQDICPRRGIEEFLPFDIENVRPERIAIGIIGRNESIEKILGWLASCKDPIQAKTSKNPHPNLFRGFCGFNKQVGFKCEVIYDNTYIRQLNKSSFDDAIKKTDNAEDRIKEIASLYLDEIRYLSKNKNPDVILCALTEKFMNFILESEEEDDEESSTSEDETDNTTSKREQNFRRYLKAKAMRYGVPIQIVRDRIASPTAEMQDEATIAWNFFAALYYKASGTPWALIRRDVAETTCYAGISFFKSRDKSTTQTSIAQIFNELGKGVILRGEEIAMRRDDRVPHLTEEQAFNLLASSLGEYYDAIKIFPKRLVLHKTSNFNDQELNGFRQAIAQRSISQVDMVSIQESDIRVYRDGRYPPMRGTQMGLSDDVHVLYTRGSVPYYATYPGKYIPTPLIVRTESCDGSPNLICDELLALTKMNWNNTQFDRKFPITIECARKVGEILKYLDQDEVMQLKYSFYM